MENKDRANISGPNPEVNFNQLRKKYKGNRQAQQQIDLHDPRSEYHVKMEQLVDAVHSGDTKKQTLLQRWFRIFYDLVGK